MIEQFEPSLRRMVADEVGAFLARCETEGRPLPDEDDRRQMARAVLRRELDNQFKAAHRRGQPWLVPQEEDRLIELVMSSVFSVMPGLDRYLARPDVTDVDANGFDDVRLTLIDGTEVRAEPIATSDAELIESIQTLARRAGRSGIEKEFTPTRPLLDLHLYDGSRLAAAAWVTKRPYVSVRRHLLVDGDQDDLVRHRMYDRGIQSLFRALVRSRKNGVIAGGQGVGKTTLLRALLHECNPDERITVLEQEPELHLDARPERHNQALLFVERPANMEGKGEVTLADLSRAVKRFRPRRIVVGEVRGPEVIDMLEAMTQGIKGSWCTLHADSSFSVFPRLPVYARKGGHEWRTGDVYQLAALAVNFVIYLDWADDGRRVVSEIRHVESYDPLSEQIITNEWFVPGPDGGAVRNPDAPIPVRLLDDLVRHGYDPSLHDDLGVRR
jgi:Flp pilus assembly CpaF family ATPase